MDARSITVPMRDGTELAGEAYLPAGSGRFPTLLRKTPYDRKHPQGLPEIEAFVGAGYAVAIVSFRGRFGSAGTFDEARHEGWLEHQDGYDTIEWVAAQPWSTGDVGTFGVSSDGQWQMSTAPTRPPHLRAMFASYPSDWYGAIIRNGVYTGTLLSWHAGQDAFARPLRSRDDWSSWLSAWKANRLPFLASFVHTEVIDMLMHPVYDAYWQDLDVATRYGDIDVPIYHEGGWYDRYIHWTLGNFAGIQQGGRSRARGTQRVIVGPWLHGGVVPNAAGPVTFGAAATIDRVSLMLQWFDERLKGADPGDSASQPVRLYLMGAEEWTSWVAWPPPGASRRYYLRAGSRDSSDSLNSGRLLLDPPSTSEAPDRYRHDPYEPIPTIGGHGGTMREWLGGPQDHRPAERRCLTYTTEPFERDLIVIGEPVAHLTASSTAIDTDFVATITDVFPDGYSAVLRQNAVRARRRGGDDTDEPLEPGRPDAFELPLDGIANVFKAGHRLRVTVASSSFPAFMPNSGSEEPIHLMTRAQEATNTVYHDAARASYLEIPVLG